MGERNLRKKGNFLAFPNNNNDDNDDADDDDDIQTYID